ncbi:diaminopimelate epimerase [Eubacteriales bacterium OttesenSCG-928-K08]|nr:diaminopimelate epimerase [Eubacteriales bacterium OttesenSCG-928-K08]
MRFTKVHGAGNDFVLIDAREFPDFDFVSVVPKICHRQVGVGADGILLVLNSDTCDIKMRIINSDGSEAEMCGNGIRAFAKYVYERGVIKSPSFDVETLAGVMRPELVIDDEGKVTAVRVDMGKPGIECEDVPVQGEGQCLNRSLNVHGRRFTYSSVRTGVPVTAVPVEDPKTFDVLTYGPAIEHHAVFPERTNVAFIKVVDRNNIEMRIWERGAGPTLACGTGSCGVAVICALNGDTERSVDVHLELATLHIDWLENGTVMMTGPAELVYDGELHFLNP